ncbi:MAG: hypothetical protein N4A31_01115 [Rickettsiales bacterium]|jgi:cellobiose-specific phosphotransferase system component IIB|nr:hypothetical protein [Rickettsiales bacterium]
MSTLENNNTKEDPGLIDLASRNSDLKLKITNIIENLETIDPVVLENQVSYMLENMMNFFAQYVEEIPNFDSLTLEQQKILISRFKAVSKSLKKRKIKSVNEMLQVFVFTVLNGIGENIENLRDLTAEEILQKKHKKDFRKFLRNAAEFEIYQINQGKSEEKINQNNFITNAIKHGVKEALKDIKLDFNMELDKEALKVLDDAHKAFHKSKQITHSRHN